MVSSTGALEPTSGWYAAQNLSQTQAPMRSTQAALAAGPTSGDLWAVWMDDGPDEEGEIRGRRWEKATRSWRPGLAVPAENLSQSQWVDQGPVVFFDRQGQAHLLWTRRMSHLQGADHDATELMWRRWDGASWSPETALLHNGTYLPGNYGFIPVETADSLLLILTFGQGYRMAEYQDGSWSEFSPWDYLDVELGDAVMDEYGLLHAAAYGENSSQLGYDPWFYDGYYLQYNGQSWTQGMNMSDTRGVAHQVALAFDEQGRLHFFWSDPDSLFSSESLKSALWERVWDGSMWSDNIEITAYNSNQAINDFSLTTDVSGALHLAWSEGLILTNAHQDLDIYYQSYEGTAWGPEEEVYSSTLPSRAPVLAVSGGMVSALWLEGPTNDQDVYFSQQLKPEPCIGLSQAHIEGPAEGAIDRLVTFVAHAGPLTATWPVTYTWQASEQVTSTHLSGFVDMIGFSWPTSGTKAITVSAENCGGSAVASVTIELAEDHTVYLPWILKSAMP